MLRICSTDQCLYVGIYYVHQHHKVKYIFLILKGRKRNKYRRRIQFEKGVAISTHKAEVGAGDFIPVGELVDEEYFCNFLNFIVI